MRSCYIMMVLLSSASLLKSQEEKKVLRKGNEVYHLGRNVEAAQQYKQSLKEKSGYKKANFNLGDALYRTAMDIKNKKMRSPDPKMTPDSAANIVFEQAAEQFEIVAKSVDNVDTMQKAWHNYGNTRLMQKNYEEAVSAYKKSLKLNPKDEDTRYNLAYALTQLKEQQKKDNKDNKDDKQQQKKQQQQDKEQISNKNDKDKKEAPQPQMSKEQAEQMLNALKNAERKMQAQRQKKGEGEVVQPEKDW